MEEAGGRPDSFSIYRIPILYIIRCKSLILSDIQKLDNDGVNVILS